MCLSGEALGDDTYVYYGCLVTQLMPHDVANSVAPSIQCLLSVKIKICVYLGINVRTTFCPLEYMGMSI